VRTLLRKTQHKSRVFSRRNAAEESGDPVGIAATISRLGRPSAGTTRRPRHRLGGVLV